MIQDVLRNTQKFKAKQRCRMRLLLIITKVTHDTEVDFVQGSKVARVPTSDSEISPVMLRMLGDWVHGTP